MSEKPASSRARRRSFPGTDSGQAEELAIETVESDPRGRPRGSPNHQVEQIELPASICPKCGSTRRAPYFNRREVTVAGVCSKTGMAYTAVIWRRTVCLDCGQHRVDRQLINEPAEPEAEKK